ncbi:H-NS histone family protein [Escherichia coli]|uniref:H-NS family histone-like protein n=1 Tax=Enterobacterales TaxID=91347 RepID=UPI000DF9DBD3|nr:MULTISPECIES: H-NS family nucleoid-associated regulatory protein [Enterobacterales]EDM3788574.1 DNA-binding protein [Salmonella enterica subsp. enterica serovar Dublin]ELK3555421.1 H-NS histone family protein [Salmonella enterica]MBE0151334.1 DNA-binding protein [Serratia fonticola]MDN6080462.1 H-NS histone family protein [Leuconostoc sp.]CAJ0555723.1 DNA-binding protein H-NS [Culicoides impunctatus]
MTELSKDEEYGIVSKHLGSITALRKFAQTKDFEWLEEVKGKLEALISESREEYELKKLEAEELEQKRQQALEYIRSLGLDPESLAEPVTVGGIKTKRKNAKSGARKAKYRFTDEGGNAKEWSGNGKRPSALQKLLDAGHSLDEYLINKEQP